MHFLLKAIRGNQKSTLANRAFAFATQKLWSTLPEEWRCLDSTDIVKRHLFRCAWHQQGHQTKHSFFGVIAQMWALFPSSGTSSTNSANRGTVFWYGYLSEHAFPFSSRDFPPCFPAVQIIKFATRTKWIKEEIISLGLGVSEKRHHF